MGSVNCIMRHGMVFHRFFLCFRAQKCSVLTIKPVQPGFLDAESASSHIIHNLRSSAKLCLEASFHATVSWAETQGGDLTSLASNFYDGSKRILFFKTLPCLLNLSIFICAVKSYFNFLCSMFSFLEKISSCNVCESLFFLKKSFKLMDGERGKNYLCSPSKSYCR